MGGGGNSAEGSPQTRKSEDNDGGPAQSHSCRGHRPQTDLRRSTCLAVRGKFMAKIKNYVWHATFTADMDGSRAWLDADLASLDRTGGGLAVPDVRAEILAMAATTVAQWAATGTTALHIARDVLFAKEATGRIPKIHVTPNSLPPSARGCRQQHSMWVTGRTLVTRTGGDALLMW
jgi:hypothetical protein